MTECPEFRQQGIRVALGIWCCIPRKPVGKFLHLTILCNLLLSFMQDFLLLNMERSWKRYENIYSQDY